MYGGEDFVCVVEVKVLIGLLVMKVVGVVELKDLDVLWDYGLVVDMLLIDVKLFKDVDLFGGNGLVFDWCLLVGW